MHTFLEQLNQRNPPLYYFGWLCLLMALACLALIPLTHTQVAGVNAWYKPFKFGLSIGLFAWTMGWYLHYPNDLVFPGHLWSTETVVIQGTGGRLNFRITTRSRAGCLCDRYDQQ